MPQRITILLEDNIFKKLRFIQAKQLKSERKSVSFSNVINQTLEKGLQRERKIS